MLQVQCNTRRLHVSRSIAESVCSTVIDYGGSNEK